MTKLTEGDLVEFVEDYGTPHNPTLHAARGDRALVVGLIDGIEGYTALARLETLDGRQLPAALVSRLKRIGSRLDATGERILRVGDRVKVSDSSYYSSFFPDADKPLRTSLYQGEEAVIVALAPDVDREDLDARNVLARIGTTTDIMAPEGLTYIGDEFVDDGPDLDDLIDRLVGSVERLEKRRKEPFDWEGIGWEELRQRKSWPTPQSMRRAADALDALTAARYGDVLRYVADLCDADLEDEEEDE